MSAADLSLSQIIAAAKQGRITVPKTGATDSQKLQAVSWLQGVEDLARWLLDPDEMPSPYFEYFISNIKILYSGMDEGS